MAFFYFYGFWAWQFQFLLVFVDTLFFIFNEYSELATNICFEDHYAGRLETMRVRPGLPTSLNLADDMVPDARLTIEYKGEEDREWKELISVSRFKRHCCRKVYNWFMNIIQRMLWNKPIR